MELNDFEKDRTIDPNQLDIEAARQGELFFKWAERAVEARGETDRLKLYLDTIEAKLQLSCREKPENFGLVKTTEASISAAIKIHDSYQEAFLKYIKAKETQALLERAVDTMEQKKRMIEVLVTLHGQQYFAGPSVPRDLISAWKEQQEQNKDRVNRKQERKIRRRKEEE